MEIIKTQMKNKFLQVSIGISMMLVAAGFFVLSINHVSASSPDKVPTPKDFMAQGGSKIGKYQVSLNSIYLTDGNLTRNAMVIDTETGKTACYYRDAGAEWKLISAQLPANPIGN